MSDEQPPKGKGRGGWRPGAGRKEGTKNIRTAAIGRQLAKKELTPRYSIIVLLTCRSGTSSTNRINGRTAAPRAGWWVGSCRGSHSSALGLALMGQIGLTLVETVRALRLTFGDRELTLVETDLRSSAPANAW